MHSISRTQSCPWVELTRGLGWVGLGPVEQKYYTCERIMLMHSISRTQSCPWVELTRGLGPVEQKYYTCERIMLMHLKHG